jgi:hypothetical protein
MEMVEPPPPTHNPHSPSQPVATCRSPYLSPRWLSEALPSPRRSPRLLPKHTRAKRYDTYDGRMISGYFRLVLHSPPEISLKCNTGFHGREGKDGVIQHIAEHYGLEVKERQRVRIVLRSITEYSERGISYKGQIATGTGRKPMIYSPQEYQILIDLVEKGYGLVTAMHQINEYREEEHLPDVGLSTVRHTINRLQPVIRRVKRRKQGNRNPDSPWAKARLRWVTQLLVRLGEHVFDHAAKENRYLSLTKTPTYFNTELLPPLIVHQIVFLTSVTRRLRSAGLATRCSHFQRMKLDCMIKMVG